MLMQKGNTRPHSNNVYNRSTLAFQLMSCRLKFKIFSAGLKINYIYLQSVKSSVSRIMYTHYIHIGKEPLAGLSYDKYYIFTVRTNHLIIPSLPEALKHM